MATNPGVSEVYDKNGVIADIEAKRFDGNRTVKLTGDVTAQQSWGGGPDPDSSTPSLGLSTTIANGAVTESKLATDAVTVSKIKDGEITKAKFNASVYNEVDGTIADGTNANLATKTQVKAYVESVIAGEGHYRGVQSVSTINTWTASNLHNGDRVITSSDPAGSGTGTLTLGNLPVVDGQECIFYVSDDQSVKIWQSSEGNYKIKQTAKPDPDVPSSGTTESLSFIDTITQNPNGEITATKKNMRSATIEHSGAVQLAGSIGATVSTENNKAASEKAVRDAINALDASEVGGNGKIISAVSEADGIISATAKTMDSAPTEWHTDTTVTSAGIKAAIDSVVSDTTDKDQVVASALVDLDARLSAVENNTSDDNLGSRTADSIDAAELKVGGKDVKVVQDPVSDPTAGGETYTAIATIAQDENGKITATKKTVPDATTDKKGVVMLQDSVDSTTTNKAVTPHAVSAAIASSAQNAVTSVDMVTAAGATSVKYTKNGQQYTVFDFMTADEASALWARAWAAAVAS